MRCQGYYCLKLLYFCKSYLSFHLQYLNKIVFFGANIKGEIIGKDLENTSTDRTDRK